MSLQVPLLHCGAMPNLALRPYCRFLRPAFTSSHTTALLTQSRRRLPSRLRLYHSPASPVASPPYGPQESRILNASLQYVPAHGFTPETLILGAEAIQHPSIALATLFPQGAFALVHQYTYNQRTALADHQTTDTSDSLEERIHKLLRHRLIQNHALQRHLSTAIALSSLPSNLPTALGELARLVDEVLYLSGDTTVTAAWYTDRAMLASIYTAAEIYMSQESDPKGQYPRTTRFLQQALESASSTRSAAAMVGTWAQAQFGGLIWGIRSKGFRI